MASGLLVVVFFLFLIMQAWAQQHQPPKVAGAVGGVAYLSPSLQTQVSYSRIHWRGHNSVKIASREGKAKAQYPDSPYKGRLELFPNNTLKISHLQKDDSSMYQVYLEDETGKENIETIFLQVYDLVPKPTVRVKVISDELALCKATLECSVGLKEVTYEWIAPNKFLQAEASASSQSVSFNPLMETYTCKVSNPVSSNSASLTYRHPCSWTGESSAATSCSTASVLVTLGHLILLLFLLILA
ncbi:CD48 antigen-like isoform X2 [Egretta garzetta]|uniref:CD48 antigen-like isoform X2 n=1 Tax=Egretta garzetta TaxID=188379 RepID=UPI00163C4A82|nr:CD48 antigen-like isoform X2 [Egretta garzetta]